MKVSLKSLCVLCLLFYALFNNHIANAVNNARVESICFAVSMNQKICLFEDSKIISQESKEKYREANQNGDDTGNVINAELRLLSKDGKIVDTVKDIQPLVSIKKSNLNMNGNPVFLETIDNSIGMGSYAGLNTSLFVIDGSKITFIKKIDLVDSLKSAWKEIPDGFLQIICRPDSKSLDSFKITFTRFQLINNQWRITEKSKKGFWENEGEPSFPKESQFP